MSDSTLLQTVISVLESHEQATGLNYEELALIAEEAIQGDLLGEPVWLEDRFAELHRKKEVQKQQESFANFPVALPRSIKTQEELDEVLTQHKQWIDGVMSGGQNGVGGRANLQGANLSGLNLKGANLSCANLKGVNFSGAVLVEANLSGCQLEGANFNRAWLAQAKLKKAKTAEASFDEADLTGVDWGT